MAKKEAVFILLGQSNAVGHKLAMRDDDVIKKPMKNVYGLSRDKNQSFSNTELEWSGYTSFGMNLAEEQDNTYSIVNCLAKHWQRHIDAGNEYNLPNLYIVQIAIGAQGVGDGYMWNPAKEKKLIPGKLGIVDISLFSFAQHIFKLIDDSFSKMGKEYEIIGLHWRGGESDMRTTTEYLLKNLKNIYVEIFDEFNRILKNPPIVLHKFVAYDRAKDIDATGMCLKNIDVINNVFKEIQEEYKNVSIFDVRSFPGYIPDVRCNGMFMTDAVHFTEEVNDWIAESILKGQV